MTPGAAEVAYRRLRAPTGNGELLLEPPLSAAAELLARNCATFQAPLAIAGRPYAEVRAAARAQLLSAARAYTRSYRDVPKLPPDTGPIFMGGHQPQLFHPGVWVKNFVLGQLAAAHGGVAVNLTIDNDVARTLAVRVPGGTAQNPLLESAPLDGVAADLPFEERAIQDRSLFQSFAQRVQKQIAPLVANPLVGAYWPLVLERAQQTDRIGACLAQARHQLEGDWGLQSLEIPQSVVCELPAFSLFAADLLARLPEFAAAHNRALAEYRQVHRLRNAAQPLPDLAQEDGWLEAPFWVWSRDNPRRKRLFAQLRSGTCTLTDRAGWTATVELALGAGLAELAKQGIRLRTRALTTTLFARLLLSDLFVHGIGGAKYDQIADALVAQFYQVPPPAFLVATATLRLPIANSARVPSDGHVLQRRLWQLTHQPERFEGAFSAACREPQSAAARWLAQKRAALASVPLPENRRAFARTIREANAQLQPCVAALRAQTEAELQRASEAERVAAILASREYAFCLFPADTIRPFLTARH
ncbi:MAG TPA: hypothetical protein VFE24_12760 [Pirellulales bacterium]|jgi:hypothetical protein|nr:hypothetical protein [Pirellulales bacterium]